MIHIETVKSGKNQLYRCCLLRGTWREGKKIKHRTLTRLSGWKQEDTGGLALALTHRRELPELLAKAKAQSGDFALRQRLSCGAVRVLREMARRTGVAEALGDGEDGRLVR